MAKQEKERIVCSPGHAKRIIATLRDSLRKYEKVHGTVVLLSALCLAGCAGDEGRTLKRVGRVNDYAGVLSEEAERALSSELEQYERETCHPIVVLTVPSLRGETIQELSARTALEWEVVHPVLKNGVLLSIAVEEGKARIELGTAMETILEEGKAEDILKKMFPAFRDNDFEKGIAQGVRAIMEEARRLEFPEEMRPAACR